MKQKQPGEISAIIGYNKQYEICAIEIYQELLNNNLEWVEFASNNAGKLDDVLIGCKNYIKAFQVKDIDGNITYSKLITPSKKNGKSIIEGCFEGWKNLKNKYNKDIIGKYISNEKPSSHDKITLFKGDEKPSFSVFLIKFWNFLKMNPIEILDNNWIPILDNLTTICKAENTEFIDFNKSFEFVLDNEYNVQEQIYGYNGYQRGKDIEKISKNILKIIGTNGNIKFDRRKLLTEFDLLGRYETYFQHSFFVDEEHYQPITETIQELEKTINKSSNGYIAIIGNAGSGKSTLLTKWINEKNDRVLKYYAYVNKEMDYDFGYRGEANLFLKDLLIQIRENEFSPQKELPADSIEELQKQLSNELKRLEFDDRKTYIIVDGLDHIEREQKVNRSLIEILPSPENIPNNVYFILGSRTIENLENLPEKIKLYLKKENSIVTIKTLTIEQIKKITESYNILLDEHQLNELKNSTLGHPLFLKYTIEELIKISKEDYNHFISQKNFSGNIYDEYEIFWNKNKLQTNFVEILGIVSRFRYTYIDINLLPNFQSDRVTLQKVKSLSEHYFYKNGNIWQFFHNSFKEFLKEKTAENFLSEEFEESTHLSYHRKIYDVIKDINSDYKWNTLYHLYHAKEYKKLVEIANQSFFRAQWFEFRYYKNILEDIKLSAKSSYFTNNPVALVDSFFSFFEISQRANNFHVSDYYNAFLQLGKTDIANSFIFNNFELLAPKTKVLDYAIALYKIGNIELSQNLLKKAEPHYILNISKEASPHRYNRNEASETDEVELIVKWAILSCLFNPINDVIDRIKIIKIVEDEYGRGGKEIY
ncbi:ATP-binding protein [Riemerella anatipestifer]|nr:ATP-binding protein [Riemerella anatipestifer]MDY3325002.1 ATP-binding protein [Riemerella anatipestifer]MDY3353811.1 ATP-binding protein [Riemerella anatipestifer]